MTQVHIEIKNIAEIKHAFGQAPRLMNDAFKQALQKSAVQVKRESMLNVSDNMVNVRTGRLRSSHRFSVSGSGLQMKAEVGPSVSYAVFLHEGTRFIRARPFLKVAAESSLDEIDDYFTRATQDVFDKIGRMV